MERFDTVTVGVITPSVQMAFDVFELVFIIVFIIVKFSWFAIRPLNAFPYSIPRPPKAKLLLMLSFGTNHPNHASPDYPNPLKDDYTDCDPVASCLRKGEREILLLPFSFRQVSTNEISDDSRYSEKFDNDDVHVS